MLVNRFSLFHDAIYDFTMRDALEWYTEYGASIPYAIYCSLCSALLCMLVSTHLA